MVGMGRSWVSTGLTITCNIVAPGPTDTPMPPTGRTGVPPKVPALGSCDPDDVAALVAFAGRARIVDHRQTVTMCGAPHCRSPASCTEDVVVVPLPEISEQTSLIVPWSAARGPACRPVKFTTGSYRDAVAVTYSCRASGPDSRSLPVRSLDLAGDLGGTPDGLAAAVPLVGHLVPFTQRPLKGRGRLRPRTRRGGYLRVDRYVGWVRSRGFVATEVSVRFAYLAGGRSPQPPGAACGRRELRYDDFVAPDCLAVAGPLVVR